MPVRSVAHAHIQTERERESEQSKPSHIVSVYVYFWQLAVSASCAVKHNICLQSINIVTASSVHNSFFFCFSFLDAEYYFVLVQLIVNNISQGKFILFLKSIKFTNLIQIAKLLFWVLNNTDTSSDDTVECNKKTTSLSTQEKGKRKISSIQQENRFLCVASHL